MRSQNIQDIYNLTKFLIEMGYGEYELWKSDVIVSVQEDNLISIYDDKKEINLEACEGYDETYNLNDLKYRKGVDNMSKVQEWENYKLFCKKNNIKPSNLKSLNLYVSTLK